MSEDFENWLAARPEVIQKLARKYPPDIKYKIKEGAPYSISASGSIVELYSYIENGDVRVAVLAKYKTESAIEREKYLGKKHNHTEAEMEVIHGQDVLVEIDPKWLEPLTETNKN